MSNKEENKNYVTPYAFGVNDNLLGKALASPTRRLFSVIFDAMVIGSLTLMSSMVMAICVLIVSIIGSVKARRKRARDGVASMAPRALGLVALLSGLFIVFSLLISNMELDGSTSDTTNVFVEGEEAVVDDANGDTDPDVIDSEKDSVSFIDWAQGKVADLGLGFGWAALYFSVFTAWFGGQTLGKMLFGIRVAKIDGTDISLWESFERYGGYSAGLATGLLGFLQIIWDANRQAIHDKISETVVLDLSKPDRNA